MSTSTDEQLTADELRELVEQGESPAQPERANYQTVPIPCTVTTEKGRQYRASGEWQYTPIGTFIPDAVEGEGPKRDVMIPYDVIEEIEFHFPDQEDADGAA